MPPWAASSRQNGQAVGMVHHIMHPSCWTEGDYCYLQDLFVSPGVRGGGVGRQLIAAVAETARSRHCSRVYWLTHETNLDAMKLYEKVAERSGFVQYRKML
jgi:GNAT superfamily N-acetyltransferase